MTKKIKKIVRHFPNLEFLGKRLKIGRQKFLGVPQTETTFVKWSASRKRLRTAGLEGTANTDPCVTQWRNFKLWAYPQDF